MQHISQDSQSSQGYNENLTDYIPNPFENNNVGNIVTTRENFFNESLYENGSVSAPLTHSATPNFQLTSRAISQQNNIPFMHQKFQKISNSILTFEENAKRQLEQVYELKDQLNQLKQCFNAQWQQPPMPRRINRNRDYRTHPYLNERHLVSSHMPTAAQTDLHNNNNELDFMNERNILSNSFRPQQADVPAATVGFPEKIFSANPQNFEFYDTNNENPEGL